MKLLEKFYTPENIEKINNFKIPLKFKNLKILFLLGILGTFCLGILESYQEGDFIWKIARNESGGLAWSLLIFIIFVSLLSKILPKIKVFKQLLPLRKEAGILVFLIVLAHTIFHFLRAGVLWQWDEMYFQAIERNWIIFFGTMAFFIMIPLFLTSNQISCKKMGYKSWKSLQCLSHVVFILAAIHVSFIEYPEKGEIDFGAFAVLGLYIFGYSYLFWKSKK